MKGEEGTRKEKMSPRFFVTWAMLLRFGVSSRSRSRGARRDERGGGNGGAPGSSPLGRSCVNPLREAHTKLVPLSFSLSLLSPYSSFPSKGCRDRPHKPLAQRAVSLRFAFSPRVP